MAFTSEITDRKSESIAYRGHVISFDKAGNLIDIPDAVMIVDSRGIISELTQWQNLCDSENLPDKVFDYGKRIISPGFIDLHVHLVQIAQSGRSGETLLGWLDKYIFPAENKFSIEEHAIKLSDWFFRELARNGTTLAAVFTSVHAKACHIAFQAAANQGLRVIMGKVLMDRNAPEYLLENLESSISESEELCDKWHAYDNGRLNYAFTPRFAATSSSKQLKLTSELWHKYPGTYMQTHLSENIDEISWIKKLFPENKNYLDVYDIHGLLGNKCIFAHCIHLEPDELISLRKADAAVVHCPSSNLFLKSGVFPYKKILAQGIKMGLGSDLAAGPEMSLFKVMKDAAYVQPELWLTARELFYHATIGGAIACKQDHIVGSLEIGKEADFIVIDPTLKTAVPFDILDHSIDDILSGLVYIGDDRMIVATYVRGKAIFKSSEAHY